jgi:hypothetical protein
MRQCLGRCALAFANARGRGTGKDEGPVAAVALKGTGLLLDNFSARSPCSKVQTNRWGCSSESRRTAMTRRSTAGRRSCSRHASSQLHHRCAVGLPTFASGILPRMRSRFAIRTQQRNGLLRVDGSRFWLSSCRSSRVSSPQSRDIRRNGLRGRSRT